MILLLEAFAFYDMDFFLLGAVNKKHILAEECSYAYIFKDGRRNFAIDKAPEPNLAALATDKEVDSSVHAAVDG